jgi:hypothetical protein
MWWLPNLYLHLSHKQRFGGHHIVSGFQKQLIEIHRLALFTWSYIIGSIHSWNSIALRTLWTILQGMSIFGAVSLGGYLLFS